MQPKTEHGYRFYWYIKHFIYKLRPESKPFPNLYKGKNIEPIQYLTSFLKIYRKCLESGDTECAFKLTQKTSFQYRLKVWIMDKYQATHSTTHLVPNSWSIQHAYAS